MKTNILKSNTLESFLESSASRYPNNTAIIEIKDYDKIYGILESKNDPNENNFNYLGKLSFSINRYLITKNIISENSKIKFIKTERHTAAFLCDNLYNLLQLFSSKLSLIQIFSIINKSNLDKVYFMQSEIEDLLEISMEFSGKIKTYRVQEKIDFLRLIKKLYQCYFIKINNYSNGVNNNCDLPIASRINLNELNIVQKDLTVTDMDLNQRDVLLMGDTLGMPTVGLLYIASYLWRNNVKSYCYFYDSSKDFETLCNNTSSLIKKIKPKIVGLSMKWFPYIEKVFETARIIKGINPDIIIVLGGNTASYYYNKVIDNDFVDYVIRGDGELPFLELCKGKNVEEIPNLVYIKKGGIYSNQIRFVHNDKNADDIYLSNLKDFLISKHASLFGMHFIPTQKGCNLNCTYCGGASEAQEKCFGRIVISLKY